MRFEDVLSDLKAIEDIKTRDIDRYNRKLIKQKEDVSDLKSHVLSEQLVHRTYFQVSLGQMDDLKEQLAFIEENEDLLRDWWQVDQLAQFIKKPVDFELAFKKAKKYIRSPMPFVRRWGYVLLMTGPEKDAANTEKILSLIKDDGEYYVQMAQAWLIAELAIYNKEEVFSFLKRTRVRYNIIGKAIQKMCDSYRITKEDKEYLRSLRSKVRL